MAAVRCRCAKNPWDLSAWALSCSLDLKIVVTLLTPFKTKTKTKREFQTRVWPTGCLIKANTLQKPYNLNAFDQTLKNYLLNNPPPKKKETVVVIYNCFTGEGIVADNHVCFASDPLEQTPPAWVLRSLFELVTSLFVGQLELDAGDLELKRRWRTWLVQPERALPHRIPGCGAAQSRVFAADKQWRVAPTHLRHQTHSAAQRKKCFGILIKIWQHTKVIITFCGWNRFPGKVSIYIPAP